MSGVSVSVLGQGTVHVSVGTGGAGSASYLHAQPTPAAVWTIAHNLGFNPTVQARTVGGLVFDAEVIHLSLNVCELRMIVPYAGTARLN